MKIIVLSNTKYKENDFIFDAISETEHLSFKVPGGQSNKSPYVWLNNPLTIAEVEFGDKRFKYPSLQEAKLISSPLTKNSDYDYLTAVSVINEIANKMFQEDEKYLLFKDIEEALTALKDGKDHLMVILILLARAIKLAGSEFEVNQCVFCGTIKDIVAFSFPDGGFVCRNCLVDTVPAELSGNQMVLIRYIFKSPNYSCVGAERYSKNDKIIVMKQLREFISDDLGVNLGSISNIL